MSSDASEQALRALSEFLVDKSSMADTLLRVSQITTEAMPSAEMAGISLLGEDGRPTTGIFTDDKAPDIDAAQYESGKGPCLDAWREKRVVRIVDMGLSIGQYPEFAAAAQTHGIESTLSLPLVAGDEGVGALNLYARDPDRSPATTRPRAPIWRRPRRSCWPTPAHTPRPLSSVSSWPRPCRAGR